MDLASRQDACYEGGRDREWAASRPPHRAFVGGGDVPTLAHAKKPGRSTTDNRGLARSVPALNFGPLGARHLARAGQLRRIEKAPLHIARSPMNRTDSDRASGPTGFELSRDRRKKGGPLLLVDRRQLEQYVLLFRGQAERHRRCSGWAARC
jgi:hypothetical protein